MASRSSQRERIKDVLEKSMIPMDVENVRVRSGLKNWESTKALLLEMTLQGVIQGQKTTKSWIFWVNRCATSSGVNTMRAELASPSDPTPTVVAQVEPRKDVRR
jgi:hypothetical protein